MTPDTLDSGLFAALALAGLLGFRHGFDADHIAVVDGMTRARQLQGSYGSARGVGLQFAAGHSATILVAALLFFGHGAALPDWLDGLGLFISATLLLLIAASNLVHAFSASSPAVRPMGPVAALLFRLTSRLTSRLTGKQLHPALVGVAFALSLDSLAQAALFAAQGGDGLTGGSAGPAGMGAVALMAAVFGLGMMLADASNGLLLSWCAQRSDTLARRASRWSSGFIAVIALATVAASVLRESKAGFALAWEHAGVWVGVGLMLMTVAVYSLRIVLQRARAAAG